MCSSTCKQLLKFLIQELHIPGAAIINICLLTILGGGNNPELTSSTPVPASTSYMKK